jgi:ATP-dependent Clp protease ATP-binding subunit ClpB
MDVNRFTHMAQEALSSSQLIAGEYGHQQIDSEHLLAALLKQDQGVVPSIVKKLNLDVQTILQEVEHVLSKKASVSGPGAGGSSYISSRMNTLLAGAEKEASNLRDEYISTEHLFIALGGEEDETGKLLRRSGLTRQRILEALKDIRGNQRVTSQNPEATYQALEGAFGKTRSRDRAG